MKISREKRFSWVSQKLEVRPSGKSGVGTFATRPIAKDEILIVQGGSIVSVEEIDANMNYELDLAYYAFQISPRLYIFPIVDREQIIIDGIFNVNHSCSPNAGFKNMLTLVSMRDVFANEEICYDYACTDVELEDEIPWSRTKCRCRSGDCRGLITGSDWRLPELQFRYRGYFSPYVQELIDKISVG